MGTGSSIPTRPDGIGKINESVRQFSAGSEPPALEIIFFHGLQRGNYEEAFWSTWLTREGSGNEVWPKDWLSEEFTNARILSVSYDSSARYSSGQLDMHNLGENLMADIILDRADIGQNCPVILVGHSLGGLVIKQFILFASGEKGRLERQVDIDKIDTFLNNVKGVFYYATPHQGSKLANWIWWIPSIWIASRSPIVKFLEIFDKERTRINANFTRVRDNNHPEMQTYAIAEGRSTQLWGPVSMMIVPEASARHDVQGYYTMQNTDHYTVCKPDARNSGTFTKLTSFIAGILGASAAEDHLSDSRGIRDKKLTSTTSGRTSGGRPSVAASNVSYRGARRGVNFGTTVN